MIRAKAKGVSRSAIDRTLRELEILFRPPDEKENAARAGAEAALNKTTTSRRHYIPPNAKRRVAA